MTFAVDMTMGSKIMNIFSPLKYIKKAQFNKEVLDNWMLKEFVPIYRRMMDGLTPGGGCSPGRARRKVDEFLSATSNRLLLAEVPPELRMWFLNLEKALADDLDMERWEAVEKADKALAEEELTALRKTYRPGQVWECRSANTNGKWLNTGHNHQPGWFFDTEYRMVKDEHGNEMSC